MLYKEDLSKEAKYVLNVLLFDNLSKEQLLEKLTDCKFLKSTNLTITDVEDLQSYISRCENCRVIPCKRFDECLDEICEKNGIFYSCHTSIVQGKKVVDDIYEEVYKTQFEELKGEANA